MSADQPSGARVRNALLTALGILGAVVLVAVASRGSTGAGQNGVRRPSDTLVDILFSLYILMIVAGGLLVALLALTVEGVLALVERVVTPAPLRRVKRRAARAGQFAPATGDA